jgi:hypothetical protein
MSTFFMGHYFRAFVISLLAQSAIQHTAGAMPSPNPADAAIAFLEAVKANNVAEAEKYLMVSNIGLTASQKDRITTQFAESLIVPRAWRSSMLKKFNATIDFLGEPLTDSKLDDCIKSIRNSPPKIVGQRATIHLGSKDGMTIIIDTPLRMEGGVWKIEIDGLLPTDEPRLLFTDGESAKQFRYSMEELQGAIEVIESIQKGFISTPEQAMGLIQEKRNRRRVSQG